MVRCWPYRRKCAVGAASADEAREGCLSWGYFRVRDGADKESYPGPMSEPACCLAPSDANARRKRPPRRLHGTFWRLAAVGFISSLSISARGASEPSVTPCALPLASGMRLSSDHTLRAWGGRGGRGVGTRCRQGHRATGTQRQEEGDTTASGASILLEPTAGCGWRLPAA